MDRLAFISDVHSNLEALRAVLQELEGVKTYCLGDLVGYGANPNEVVKMLRERGVISIQGNHDRAVVEADIGRFNGRAGRAVMWTRSRCEDETVEYLKSLPTERRVELPDFPLYLTHGSPDDNLWEYVDPSTHSGVLDHYISKLRVKGIGLGHTHFPYVWYGRQGLVFNPGSVGQPRSDDKRASYAILTVEDGTGVVSERKVEYDWRSASDKILKEGLPVELAARLRPLSRA